MKQFALFWRTTAAMSLMSLLGCGGDLVLPGTGGAGFELAVLEGNGQTGRVGEPLPDPLVVELRGSGGELVAGKRVAFIAAGSQGAGAFDPDTAVTNSLGQALTQWVLGSVPGVYTAEARIVPAGDAVVPAVPIQASAVAGDPDTLRSLSPASQSGPRSETLEEPLVVLVVDRFGNPVEGAEVRWKVTAGGGEVSAETERTRIDGTSSVVWTLGKRSGVQELAATVDGASGSPVTFTAIAHF